MAYTSRVPDPLSTATVKPGSEYTPYNYGYMACDPSKSLTGSSNYNGWRAWALGSIKFNFDCGAGCVPKRIYIENHHDNGTGTGEGVRNVLVYGTNSATAFANTTYSDTTDLTLLATLEVAQHPESNVAAPQIYLLDNASKAVYRYIVLRIADNWGSGVGIGIRRIEIQSGSISAALEQRWGIRMGTELVQSWGNAPVVQRGLYQPWSNAQVLQADLVQRWESSHILRSGLEQGWHIFGVISAALEQRWAITASLVQSALEQGWDLRELNFLQSGLVQRWSLVADNEVLTYQVSALCNGRSLGITSITLEVSLDQDVLQCDLVLAAEADYLACAIGDPLTITITTSWATETYSLVITSPRISEEWGNIQYQVEAQSPAVRLDAPWAEAVEGELTGMASAIAATIAAPLAIDWHTVDWEIPPSTWIASGDSPLALLKQLAAAVGAVVQSRADGSLVVLPEVPLPITGWDAATPDHTLVETEDCFTTGSTPELRSGYNRFVVGNAAGSNQGERIEEEQVSASVRLVRVYQVPWLDDFDLVHTGGGWVQLEPMGIEERQIEETVEIVAGGGRTQYPCVSVVATAWQQTSLGAITVAEDGTVSSATPAESLLALTYTTRCRMWRVRDPNNESLQVVVR